MEPIEGLLSLPGLHLLCIIATNHLGCPLISFLVVDSNRDADVFRRRGVCKERIYIYVCFAITVHLGVPQFLL